MPMFKRGDVCVITNRIWGDFWAKGEPDYIGIRVRISDTGRSSDTGEEAYVFEMVDDVTYTNGRGDSFDKDNPPYSTIQESALRKVNNGFGQWFKKIKDRDVVGHEAAVAAPQRK